MTRYAEPYQRSVTLFRIVSFHSSVTAGVDHRPACAHVVKPAVQYTCHPYLHYHHRWYQGVTGHLGLRNKLRPGRSQPS